jgi:hypothetical protein
VGRQTAEGWYYADNGSRPYYHAVEEGLPALALAIYAQTDTGQTQTANINSISSEYSPSTGLLSDFVGWNNNGYAPAPANFLEKDGDGYFSWNAARVPWRVPMDYLLSGDTRALDQIRKTNEWIQQK